MVKEYYIIKMVANIVVCGKIVIQCGYGKLIKSNGDIYEGEFYKIKDEWKRGV